MKYLTAYFIVSTIFYILLAFWVPRENFYQLISCFGVLFLTYGGLLYYLKNAGSTFKSYLKYSIVFGVFIRIVLLFSIPSLTDDFYRFYWDGLLNVNGISPFAYTPTELLDNGIAGNIEGINQALYDKLNSPDYYSIYPPFCQIVFSVGAVVFPKSVWGAMYIYKIFMLAFELISLFFLIKLVKRFKMPTYNLLWYWLNPLVIIELSANIHFEAGMITALLGAIYFLTQSKIIQQKIPYKQFFNFKSPVFDYSSIISSVLFAISVLFKLLPLMFLPALIKRLGFLKMLIYGAMVLSITVIAFSMYINPSQIPNLFESVQLYFAKFEFNASIYYIFRWIGFQNTGYNQIAVIGANLSKVALGLIIILALFTKNKTWKNLPTIFMFSLLVYLLTSTIVHPWYITPLIALSVLTNFRSIIVWSTLIPLSYIHYHHGVYQENYWLIFIEYIIFMSVLIVEVSQNVDNQILTSKSRKK